MRKLRINAILLHYHNQLVSYLQLSTELEDMFNNEYYNTHGKMNYNKYLQAARILRANIDVCITRYQIIASYTDAGYDPNCDANKRAQRAMEKLNFFLN